MPIRFRCQDCRSKVKVPEGTQGKQVKCPRCGRIQSVPRHHSHNNAHPEADGVTVHTLVGSMHKAPKRKEVLVGAGGNGFDHYEAHDDGATGGRDLSDGPEIGYANNHRPHDGMSRKQRRRMEAAARQAEQAREEATAREIEEREQASIDESRRRVADLFATSRETSFEEESPASESTAAPAPESAKAATPPKAIAFGGNGAAARQEQAATPSVKQTSPAPARVARTQAPEDYDAEEPESRWTFDLTSEAYPFLRVIPWVLRITALMLIGPAFKVMLVADAQGFSGVVSLLVLFMGLALVVVTWTVGEIATAVRDIAMRKLPG